MLTLVFGMPVSKGKVNKSQDLYLIAKETTGDCEQGFVFKHVNTVLYKLHLQVQYFTSYNTVAMMLNRFNEVLYKLRLQVMVL